MKACAKQKLPEGLGIKIERQKRSTKIFLYVDLDFKVHSIHL